MAKQKLKRIYIKNSQWGRGRSSAARLVSASSGLMCCLAFDALAYGKSKAEIRGCLMPGEVGILDWAKLPVVPLDDPRFDDCEDLEDQAADVNDSTEITDAERIAYLSKMFPAAGRQFVYLENA